jgi:hypothetical protein
MTASDDFREAALARAGGDQELRELIRRCIDEGDARACAELDRRGLEPPMIDVVADREDGSGIRAGALIPMA